MHLCFIDESGTPAKPDRQSPRFFIIAGLIIPEEQWYSIRHKLIGLKARKHYRGELKWRYFAPNNRDDNNPMREWGMDERNEFRSAVFNIITGQRSVKAVCGICDAPLAYRLINVNSQEDIYFRTYKAATERFQYFLQDVTRLSGRHVSGIIVADHRNRGEDNRMREQHEKLIRETNAYTSTYSNFIETIFFSPSHMSIGIQLSDMIAGAVWRRFEHDDATWFERVQPVLRRSPDGRVDGFGIARFPKRDWTGPVIE